VQVSVNYDNAVAAVERSLRSDNERTRRLVQRFLITRVCSVCHGTRLRPEALTSQLGGRNIAEISALGLTEPREFAAGLPAGLPAELSRLTTGLLCCRASQLLAGSAFHPWPGGIPLKRRRAPERSLRPAGHLIFVVVCGKPRPWWPDKAVGDRHGFTVGCRAASADAELGNLRGDDHGRWRHWRPLPSVWRTQSQALPGWPSVASMVDE